MQTSGAMRDLIGGWEGLRLEAYQDVVGVWTIGYGHTGPDVTYATPKITPEQADDLLEDDLGKFERGVAMYLGDAKATQGQFDAMVSLSYNVGLGNFRSSTVLREHKEGDFEHAADAFLLWNKAGGKVFEGLVRRREGEREHYLADTPHS